MLRGGNWNNNWNDVPVEACWVRQLGELTGLRIGTPNFTLY